MAIFSNVEPLKMWVHKILPLVYDDSMSYYETLCKVVQKLNEVVSLSNEQTEYLNNWLTSTEESLERWKTDTRDELEGKINDDLSEAINRLETEFADELLDAEGMIYGTQNNVPVEEGSEYYQNNAEFFKERASASALESRAYANGENASPLFANNNSKYFRERSEAWAVGEVNGADVPDTDETYENNAKFYAGEAERAALTFVPDPTLTEANRPAEAKATGDAIADLKSALENNGIPKSYSYTGTSNLKVQDAVPANIPIYMEVLDGTATGVRFDFFRSDNTRYQLTINKGKSMVYVPPESYTQVYAYPLPWDGNSKSALFLYCQAINGVKENLYNDNFAYRPEIDINISSSNYSSYFTDAGSAPMWRSYVIASSVTSNMISNLPVYGRYGILYTFTAQRTNNISTQIYASITTKQEMWFRTSTASGATATYGAWKKFIDSEDWQNAVKIDDVDTLISDVCKHGSWESTIGGQVFSQSVTQGERYRLYVWNITGAIADNPILFRHNSDSTNTNLKDYKKNIDNTLYWDITIPADSETIYLYGVKDSGSAKISCNYALIKVEGGIVDTLQTEIDDLPAKTTNIRTCKIFKRVVCCGDSYTAGFVNLTGSNASETNEEFAWPHYMATLTGNEWINCGKSGANVLTWQEDSRGLPAAQTAGLSQAYVIGLMINDASATVRHVDLGTVDDIGTSAQTYYGGMSQIIEALNDISPSAKIFICTCPKTESVFTDYNEAVRTIVSTLSGTYPVHLLDLAAHRYLFENNSLKNDYINGHYSPIGYEQFSEIIAYLMSDYINNHISAFQDVYSIPYASNNG